ncbi:hypothetical protein L7F22_010653 [Adiantum nelumboides]|nr:hypothetical protein [Adiantum nelumboides]
MGSFPFLLYPSLQRMMRTSDHLEAPQKNLIYTVDDVQKKNLFGPTSLTELDTVYNMVVSKHSFALSEYNEAFKKLELLQTEAEPNAEVEILGGYNCEEQDPKVEVQVEKEGVLEKDSLENGDQAKNCPSSMKDNEVSARDTSPSILQTIQMMQRERKRKMTGEDTDIIIEKSKPPQENDDASVDAGGDASCAGGAVGVGGDASCAVGAGGAGEDTEIIIEKSEPPQEDGDASVDVGGDASCVGGAEYVRHNDGTGYFKGLREKCIQSHRRENFYVEIEAMATALAAQLQALASSSTDGSFYKLNTRPSILFDAREAADVDTTSIYSLALSGLEELATANPFFSNFKKTLFNVESCQTDRELQGHDFNANLNTSIHNFFYLVSDFVLLSAAHQTLEYLIRRYKIHIYNVDDLIKFILPYHETSLFVRIVQLSNIEKTRWRFLEGVKKSGAAPPRELLVQQCFHDLAVLDGICESAHMLKIGSQTVRARTTYSFCVATIIEVLNASQTIDSTLVNKILTFVVQSFDKKSSEEFEVRIAICVFELTLLK